MPIRVEIVSQDRLVYQGDADIVVLPGGDGEMGDFAESFPIALNADLWYPVRVSVSGKRE